MHGPHKYIKINLGGEGEGVHAHMCVSNVAEQGQTTLKIPVCVWGGVGGCVGVSITTDKKSSEMNILNFNK